MAARAQKSVIQEEELDAAVARLLDIARKTGHEIAQTPGRLSVRHPDQADVSQLLRDGLRRALEDEVIPAIAPTLDRDYLPEISMEANALAHADSTPVDSEPAIIAQRDVDREVIKKALIGLRLSRLRQIAGSLDLGISGAAEELATRVARAYLWDEGEIARLIQDNEDDETRPIRGTVERIFPLGATPDIPYVAERLRVVDGRYMRIGVAKWFFFRSVTLDGESVSVRGSYRAYEAELSERDGEPQLVPVPSAWDIDFVVRARQNIAIRNGNVTTARQAIKALALAARIEPKGYVAMPTASVARSLQGSSEFLLDLVWTRLRMEGVAVEDLSVARFRLSDDTDDGDNRPALKAVRFEGRHLLDSIEACRLLVTQKRPLGEISFWASYRPQPGSLPLRFEIRISVESDHVLVNTGYGQHAEQSVLAHARVVRAVQLEMENGVADEVRLQDLVRRIAARADDTVAPDQPSVLVDDEPTASSGH